MSSKMYSEKTMHWLIILRIMVLLILVLFGGVICLTLLLGFVIGSCLCVLIIALVSPFDFFQIVGYSFFWIRKLLVIVDNYICTFHIYSCLMEVVLA
ncbi:hypothetical protein RchiOBHm_Chr7g0188831 [Rosa chinensis]|uniref:Uncharacterized protein n=1 Tax=Rosa chinensis TaxID=74649 RepID=A0A2P6P4K9_ROSCH|nr:hypothetical protein RchiOBHm_Chr7g0188831 [Rosa chinensis]